MPPQDISLIPKVCRKQTEKPYPWYAAYARQTRTHEKSRSKDASHHGELASRLCRGQPLSTCLTPLHGDKKSPRCACHITRRGLVKRDIPLGLYGARGQPTLPLTFPRESRQT